MAIITLKVTVNVTNAKKHVYTEDMATGLAQRVEKIGAFFVEDSEMYRATCAVAKVELVYDQLGLVVLDPGEQLPCLWCGAVVEQISAGRARLYCSDAHRQAAYRHRHHLA